MTRLGPGSRVCCTSAQSTHDELSHLRAISYTLSVAGRFAAPYFRQSVTVRTLVHLTWHGASQTNREGELDLSVESSTAATLYRAREVVPTFGPPAAVAPTGMVTRSGRVVGVGEFEELRRSFAEATVVDFGESWVVPGLHDAHCHPTIAADELCHLRIPEQKQGDAEYVASEISQLPDSNGWTKLVGWLESRTDSGPVGTPLLDRWSPDKPLLLTHTSGHYG